jgi:hypothetical protein
MTKSSEPESRRCENGYTTSQINQNATLPAERTGLLSPFFKRHFASKKTPISFCNSVINETQNYTHVFPCFKAIFKAVIKCSASPSGIIAAPKLEQR